MGEISPANMHTLKMSTQTKMPEKMRQGGLHLPCFSITSPKLHYLITDSQVSAYHLPAMQPSPRIQRTSSSQHGSCPLPSAHSHSHPFFAPPPLRSALATSLTPRRSRPFVRAAARQERQHTCRRQFNLQNMGGDRQATYVTR